MENIQVLINGIGYVKLTFSDNSKRVVRTSFNPEVLASAEVKAREDAIYDLDRKCWFTLPESVSIEISLTKPVLEGVDSFVDRF